MSSQSIKRAAFYLESLGHLRGKEFPDALHIAGALRAAEIAHGELLDALKDVIACEHDRDEESRNFSEERLADYQAIITKAESVS